MKFTLTNTLENKKKNRSIQVTFSVRKKVSRKKKTSVARNEAKMVSNLFFSVFFINFSFV